ncbi:D-alanyl-D-alanine carboxypeptidase/D-alanyl-D-alanine endopeptidase [Saccharomonospora glauca]|uniref:D-alanyl-D-alanine carboxypeptidase, serine-type, PBP4 family n=1 Tax=Saccharomonospora glauca K62 TaxID=928724 RepID=I1D781_9PSEU|nr:D-alanyl-D-alanine carboxypeptidase/D-alanyl-D-alanine-endopeptidase [Saccharomonospora glauca]EIF00806.1 D-alanyl-D-alanine carboxypeptidase, serine-type, PBP4 family [Saccharomonospora glauca K62]
MPPRDASRGEGGPVDSVPRADTGTQAAIPAAASETASPNQSVPPGPEPSPDSGDAPSRKPRRRLLVTVSIAVVLLLVAGVTLALPDVSNRLGLPWAPNAPRADPPRPQEVRLALNEVSDSAEGPTPEGVEAAIGELASDSDLGTLTGSVVDPTTGEQLWARDADTVATPASTTKVLVGAAALLALDHDMRLPTRVVRGSEPGTVVLVGGGDVTLSSLPEGQESIYPGAARLDDLVAQVEEAAGGDVERVELDLSAYTGPEKGDGWAPEDVPSTYMAKVQPAMLDGGRSQATVGNSKRRGDPAEHLLREFADRIGAEAGGTTTAPSDAEVLGEVWSPPVDELVRHMLVESDNLLGEVLARQVAVAEGKEPSFTGGAEATLDVLKRNGIDVDGAVLHDGSGLSPLNKVSAATLTQVIAKAAGPDDEDEVTVKLRPLLVGMPVAGGSGTLAGRYDEEESEAGRGWVRAKTGTLTGVHTLAGVVLTSDNRVLTFALMSTGEDWDRARAALDRIAAALHGCGCR